MRCPDRQVRVAILGPPGSGKSTQAKRLASTCGLANIYAGELLRQEADSNSPFAERIRSCLDAGALVPVDIVLNLVETSLAHTPNGFVLDGFPRTMEQVLALEVVLQEMHQRLDAVIYLYVSDEEATRRLLARGRPDDTPELIARRLQIYHTETDPVIEFYRDKSLLKTVSGMGNEDHVSRELLTAVHVTGSSHSVTT